MENSDRHTVKPWFNGKIDLAPLVVDLAQQGFPLVGEWIDHRQGCVVATLVYRRNSVINLFLRPEPRGLRLASWRAATTAIHGWAGPIGGLEFWAVSDVEEQHLDLLRDEFKAAMKG